MANPNTTETTAVPFRSTYPIDFLLYNVDQQPILYIDDIDDTLFLEIKNASSSVIEMDKLDDKSGASPENHHFELCFRPGTLDDQCLIKLAKATKGWKMEPLKDGKGTAAKNPDGTVSFFIMKTGASSSIEPGQSFKLTLENITPSGSGGTHGTRVELKYRNLRYKGSETDLTGFRVTHMAVINHQGRKQIPLNVGFVGINKILNDGTTTNDLTLRISNILKGDPEYLERSTITLRGEDENSDEKPQSELIISFDAGDETMVWALGTSSQVSAITIKNIKHKKFDEGKYSPLEDKWTITPEKQGESYSIKLTPQKTIRLGAGDFIQMKLGPIVTNLPNGRTNLYLHYHNVPGYWDGTFTVTIEKSPMIIQRNNVGIGLFPPNIYFFSIEKQKMVGTEFDSLIENLNRYTVSDNLRERFNENNVSLSTTTWVEVEEENLKWKIVGDDGDYIINLQGKGDQQRLVVKQSNIGLAVKGNTHLNNNLTVEGNTILKDSLTVNGNLSLPALSAEAFNGIKLSRKDEQARTHVWAIYHMNERYGKNGLQLWEYKADSTGRLCGGNQDDGAMCHMRLTILEGGNVGIRTKTPKTELDVAGTVQANSFTSTNGEGMIPVGGIIMWSGSDAQIPEGWKLCDGNNGTPNLKGRFIVGVDPESKDYKYSKKGTVGGEATHALKTEEMPSHGHGGNTSSAGEHNHGIDGSHASDLDKKARSYKGQYGVDMYKEVNSVKEHGLVYTNAVGHNHHISVEPTGGNTPHENRPPFYALCFIMKVK